MIGIFFLSAYKCAVRGKSKILSLLIRGSFAKYGRKTVIVFPLRVSGEKRIIVGDNVYIGANCWLQTIPDGNNITPAIAIGNGTSIVGSCVISAVRNVVIEDKVLIAKNVYISDHVHNYSDQAIPIIDQGIYKMAPVTIKSGAWIGQNAVICPGVTIGHNSVVGANSVVKEDIPDYSIAVGAPARIIKKIS